jgi:DNA-directed RNA polymerase beta subunit
MLSQLLRESSDLPAPQTKRHHATEDSRSGTTAEDDAARALQLIPAKLLEGRQQIPALLTEEVVLDILRSEWAHNGGTSHIKHSMQIFIERGLHQMVMESPVIETESQKARHRATIMGMYIGKPMAKNHDGFYDIMDPTSARLTRHTFCVPVIIDVEHNVYYSSSSKPRTTTWQNVDHGIVLLEIKIGYAKARGETQERIARLEDQLAKAKAARAAAMAAAAAAAAATPYKQRASTAGAASAGDAAAGGSAIVTSATSTGPQRKARPPRHAIVDALPPNARVPTNTWILQERRLLQQISHFFIPILTPDMCFLIKGAEKTILTQKRQHVNRIFITPAIRAPYTWTAEMRCVHPGKARSTSTFKLHIACGPRGSGVLSSSVIVPFITTKNKTRIPVAALCRLLGFRSVEEVATSAATSGALTGAVPIAADSPWNTPAIHATRQWVLALLKDDAHCFIDEATGETLDFFAMSREALLTWVCERDRSPGRRRTGDSRAPYMAHLTANEVFPEMGLDSSAQTIARKGRLLALIIGRLSYVARNLQAQDDRDHAGNKQYDLPGQSIALLARQFNRQFKRRAAGQIRRQCDAGRLSTLHTIMEVRRTTEGIANAIAQGNFGIQKGCSTQMGVSQSLSRQNETATSSHHRRVNTPLKREGKQAKPRQLHTSSFGLLCPAETPEGASCGLVEQMAQCVVFCMGHSPERLIKTISSLLMAEGYFTPLDSTSCEGKMALLLPRPQRTQAVLIPAGSAGTSASTSVSTSTSASTSTSTSVSAPSSSSDYGALAGVPLAAARQVVDEYVDMVVAPVQFTSRINILHHSDEELEFVRRQQLEVDSRVMYMDKESLLRVMVNGIFIGTVHDGHQATRALRRARRARLIPIDVAIEPMYACGVLNIDAEAGGMRRPLFVMHPEHALTEVADLHAQYANAPPAYLWKYLLQQGLVEYVSKHEEETLLVLESPCSATGMLPAPHAPLEEYTHCELHPSVILGTAAAQIPAANHNQAPRVAYFGALAKQAAAAPSLQPPHTNSIQGVYPQDPLITTWLEHTMDLQPTGCNVVVGNMHKEGKNQEDSKIISVDSINAGQLSAMYTKIVTADCQTGSGADSQRFRKSTEAETVYTRKTSNYDTVQGNGLPLVGTHMRGGDVIAAKSTFVNETGCTMRCRNERDQSEVMPPRAKTFVVDSVTMCSGRDDRSIATVSMHTARPVKEGDKTTSRHAQKGVCGALERSTDMYYRADGVCTEVIMNPHAFPSRMTIGHLKECAIGNACAQSGQRADLTPFRGVPMAAVRQQLEAQGVPNLGDTIVYDGVTGRHCKTPQFMGFGYELRIKQMTDDKANARARGPVNTITQQPIEGMNQLGGLRMGAMEAACIQAYGGAAVLKDRLCQQSDHSEQPVCIRCGEFAMERAPKEVRPYVFERNGTAGYCSVCRTAGTVFKVAMPFISKVLCQELNAMHISTALQLDVNPSLDTHCAASAAVAPPGHGVVDMGGDSCAEGAGNGDERGDHSDSDDDGVAGDVAHIARKIARQSRNISHILASGLHAARHRSRASHTRSRRITSGDAPSPLNELTIGAPSVPSGFGICDDRATSSNSSGFVSGRVADSYPRRSGRIQQESFRKRSGTDGGNASSKRHRTSSAAIPQATFYSSSALLDDIAEECPPSPSQDSLPLLFRNNRPITPATYQHDPTDVPSPTYGGASPAYQPPSPTYHGISPAYQPPSPTYHGASPAYQPPSPTYHGASPAYRPAYCPSSPAYQPSSPTYDET